MGRSYYVEGKTNLTVSDWTILSPTNVATSTSMSYCIDRPTDYAFFQVVELAEVSPPPPPSGTNTFINPTSGGFADEHLSELAGRRGPQLLRRGQNKSYSFGLDDSFSNQRRDQHEHELIVSTARQTMPSSRSSNWRRYHRRRRRARTRSSIQRLTVSPTKFV